MTGAAGAQPQWPSGGSGADRGGHPIRDPRQHTADGRAYRGIVYAWCNRSEGGRRGDVEFSGGAGSTAGVFWP